jgi:ribokinase
MLAGRIKDKKMKVLNYGSLNIDYVYEVEHFTRAGETQSSTSLKLYGGGKGLNQSIALAKSGAKVYHAGAVGEKDSAMLLKQLEDVGVDVNLIVKKEGSSGHAIIQKIRSGQNSILIYGGSNQKITKEEVEKTLQTFEKGDFIVLQNEISEVGYIMEKAHEKGMKIVFNPSPLNNKISTYPLQYVNYFILNEVEAQDLCASIMRREELVVKVSEMFPQAKIVLTLGENGSIYKDEKQKIFQPIYNVVPVDTTAAGDTFTGYFIGSIMAGKAAKEALEISAKAAAIAVTRDGAGVSIPTIKEVEEFEM